MTKPERAMTILCYLCIGIGFGLILSPNGDWSYAFAGIVPALVMLLVIHKRQGTKR